MSFFRGILIFFICAQVTYASSIRSLAGLTNNPYQIRNDILLYINTAVEPLSRPWKAFIKVASNQQFIYYRAKTYEEASNAIKENSIAMRCLSMEYNNNEEYIIFQNIESMMKDTEERRRHIFEASNRLFGNRGWDHPRISRLELQDKCESGDYA